jgi:hypothetical protein
MLSPTTENAPTLDGLNNEGNTLRSGESQDFDKLKHQGYQANFQKQRKGEGAIPINHTILLKMGSSSSADTNLVLNMADGQTEGRGEPIVATDDNPELRDCVAPLGISSIRPAQQQ